jgi:hypothetical protein
LNDRAGGSEGRASDLRGPGTVFGATWQLQAEGLCRAEETADGRG